MPFKKNTAVAAFLFHMVASADGSDITTGSPQGYYSLDGGAQTVISVAASHLGNGQWQIPLAASELNGDVVGLEFVHSSGISAHFTVKTESVLVSELNDITAGSVWDEARSAHVSAGTFGQGIASVQGSITGDVSGSIAGIVGGSMTGGVGGSLAGGVGGDLSGSVVGIIGGSVTGGIGGSVAGGVASIAASGISASSIATAAADIVADEVWDEVLSSGAHATLFSAGKRLQNLVLRGGTAIAGCPQGIVFPGPWSSTDGIYEQNIVSIVDGTGVAQTRMILEYNGGSRLAYLDRPWITEPDSTSEIELLPSVDEIATDHGIIVTGSATGVTLPSSAGSINDTYIGSVIIIRGGTGEGQARLITDYVGSTKDVTVSDAWTTIPDSTSIYKIIPVGRSIVDSVHTGAIDAGALATDAVDEIADGVWDEARSGHTSAGTFGQGIASVQGSMTGDVSGSVAGDVGGNVVGDVAGSITGNVGGNVVGSVASVTGNVAGDISGSVVGNVGGNVVGSVGSIAASGISASSFDAGAIDGQALGASAISASNFAANAITDVIIAASALADDINAEIVDVLNGDTFAEPGQGAPGATVTLAAKIGYLYKAFRNKLEQTATTLSIYDDAGTTVDQKSTVSDDGTTFTRGEIGSGP
jgi:hypothetical protein